jgi:chromosome segregation ATPase
MSDKVIARYNAKADTVYGKHLLSEANIHMFGGVRLAGDLLFYGSIEPQPGVSITEKDSGVPLPNRNFYLLRPVEAGDGYRIVGIDEELAEGDEIVTELSGGRWDRSVWHANYPLITVRSALKRCSNAIVAVRRKVERRTATEVRLSQQVEAQEQLLAGTLAELERLQSRNKELASTVQLTETRNFELQQSLGNTLASLEGAVDRHADRTSKLHQVLARFASLADNAAAIAEASGCCKETQSAYGTAAQAYRNAAHLLQKELL